MMRMHASGIRRAEIMGAFLQMFAALLTIAAGRPDNPCLVLLRKGTTP